jgi:hypothetical protein
VFPPNPEEAPPPEVKKFFDLLKAAEEPLHEHNSFYPCFRDSTYGY